MADNARESLASVIWHHKPHLTAPIGTNHAIELADAILAAGWVRCLHTNQGVAFSNNNGPWHRNCRDCGKQWTE